MTNEDELPEEFLSEEERKEILRKINSGVCWLGRSIPEVETLEGRRIRLNDTIFDFINKPVLTHEERANARHLLELLEKKEKGLMNRLKHEKLRDEEADELLDRICRLLRAIDDLRDLDDPVKIKYHRKKIMAEVADEKRWLKFLERVGV